MRLIFLGFLLCSLSAFGQYRTLRGTVHDPNNNPLENVYIETGNPDFTTHSNNYGEFKITFPDTISSLTLQKSGFRKTKKHITSNDTITVELSFSNYLELSVEELLQIKISTVTLKEQNISEVPGIVSIITREELRNMGIRTVREALTLVPGFAPLQNDDEQILSVRGIYGTTNQKILLMRDGHSLNEGNLDIPQTEYSLSIENIKKIEIIRGPGASIYGNSALAAVVNIITVDDDEASINVGIGSYGQFNLDAVISRNIDNRSSLMLYGRFGNVAGQPFNVQVSDNTGNTLYAGKYYTNRYPRNYDAGFKYNTRLYSTSFSARKHQYQTFWSSQGAYTNTDSLFVQPELSQSSIHTDILVTPSVSEKVHVFLRHSVDYSVLTNYRLIGPIDTFKYTHGNIQANQWNVLKNGANYHAIWDYSEKGQLTFGLSYEYRKYMASWILSNTNDSSKVTLSRQPFFPEGNESREAAFFQIQQILTSWMRLDIGGRYDIAQQFAETFNPRIAVLLDPSRLFTIKLIYTQAFQAPGYSYRTSNAAFSGSIEQLQPERLSTWQSSVRCNFENSSFIEISGYYNQLSNLITRIDQKYYGNYGELASYGLEVEGRYNSSKLSAFANYSLVLPDEKHIDEKFMSTNIAGDQFKYIPCQTSNAGFTVRPIPLINATLYGQYYSNIKVQNETKLSPRLLLNATLSMNNLIANTTLSLSTYNLTDKRYKLGDASVSPIEQPGRWFMVSFIYNFSSAGL